MGRFSVEIDKISDENVILDGEYRFSVITDRIIRIEKSKSGAFVDLPTQVIMHRNIGQPLFKYEINEYGAKHEKGIHIHGIIADCSFGLFCPGNRQERKES